MKRVTTAFRESFYSKIFQNYIYLSIYQIVNFSVPLIIVPFIIKYLGVERLGEIAFSYAFVNYFSVLTDYGFNLSATKSVSVNRNNRQEINRIYSTVMLTKLLFFIGALVAFCILLLIPFFSKSYLLHLSSFSIVLAQVLMPVWLLQGLEDMKYLAIFNTFSKLVFAACIICFVRVSDDYIYVNLFQGLGGILAAIASNILIRKKMKIEFVRVVSVDILTEIKSGWVLFLSSLAVNIYVNSNAFILGLLTNPVQLGYYTIAEKVYFALKQFGNVYSQVIYPQVCVLAGKSLELLKQFQRRVFLPFIVFLIFPCLFVFLLADQICLFFLKKIDPNEVFLIKTFCIIPIVVAVDIPYFQALLALNKKSYYGITLIAGCILNIILNLFLAQHYAAIGTTISVLLTELFISISLMACFNRVVANYPKSLLTR